MRTRHKYNQDTESEYVSVEWLQQRLGCTFEETLEWAWMHNTYIEGGDVLPKDKAALLIMWSKDAEAAAEDATWD